MIWLPLAGSLLLWLVATTLSGAMILGFAGRIGVPTGSPFELTLVWLYFSLILGRCVFLSVYAAGLRARVAESRARLAESMEQIQELATHDELTKVLNRRALMTSLERERRAPRAPAPRSASRCSSRPFQGGQRHARTRRRRRSAEACRAHRP